MPWIPDNIFISKTYRSDPCRQIFNTDGKSSMSNLKNIHIRSIYPKASTFLKKDHWDVFLVLTNNYWIFFITLLSGLSGSL